MTADALDAALRGADRLDASRAASSAAPASRIGQSCSRTSRGAGSYSATAPIRSRRLKDPLAFASLCERPRRYRIPRRHSSRPPRRRRLARQATRRRGRKPCQVPRGERSGDGTYYPAACRRARPSRCSSSPMGNARAFSAAARNGRASTPRQPFRYGGAVRPRRVRRDRRRARRMCAAHRSRDTPVRTEQRGFSCRGGRDSGYWRSTHDQARRSTSSSRREDRSSLCTCRHAPARLHFASAELGLARPPWRSSTPRRDLTHSGSGLAGLDRGSAARRQRDQGGRAVVHGACFRPERDGSETIGRRQACDGSPLMDERKEHEQRRQRERARRRIGRAARRAMPTRLKIGVARGALGESLIDAGSTHPGSIAAGLRIAEICMGGLGSVALELVHRHAATGRGRWSPLVESGDRLPCAASMPAGGSRTATGRKILRARLRPGSRARAPRAAVRAARLSRTGPSRRRWCWRAPSPPPPAVVSKVAQRLRRRARRADFHLRADAEPDRQRAGRRTRARGRACTRPMSSDFRSSGSSTGSARRRCRPPHPGFRHRDGPHQRRDHLRRTCSTLRDRPGRRCARACREAAERRLARLRPAVRRDLQARQGRLLRHRPDAVQPGGGHRHGARQRRELSRGRA